MFQNRPHSTDPCISSAPLTSLSTSQPQPLRKPHHIRSPTSYVLCIPKRSLPRRATQRGNQSGSRPHTTSTTRDGHVSMNREDDFLDLTSRTPRNHGPPEESQMTGSLRLALRSVSDARKTRLTRQTQVLEWSCYGSLQCAPMK